MAYQTLIEANSEGGNKMENATMEDKKGIGIGLVIVAAVALWLFMSGKLAGLIPGVAPGAAPETVSEALKKLPPGDKEIASQVGMLKVTHVPVVGPVYSYETGIGERLLPSSQAKLEQAGYEVPAGVLPVIPVSEGSYFVYYPGF